MPFSRRRRMLSAALSTLRKAAGHPLFCNTLQFRRLCQALARSTAFCSPSCRLRLWGSESFPDVLLRLLYDLAFWKQRWAGSPRCFHSAAAFAGQFLPVDGPKYEPPALSGSPARVPGNGYFPLPHTVLLSATPRLPYPHILLRLHKIALDSWRIW